MSDVARYDYFSIFVCINQLFLSKFTKIMGSTKMCMYGGTRTGACLEHFQALCAPEAWGGGGFTAEQSLQDGVVSVHCVYHQLPGAEHKVRARLKIVMSRPATAERSRSGAEVSGAVPLGEKQEAR